MTSCRTTQERFCLMPFLIIEAMNDGLSLLDVLYQAEVTHQVGILNGRNGSEYYKETRYFEDEESAKDYLDQLVQANAPNPHEYGDWGLYIYRNNNKDTYKLYQLEAI